VIADALVGWVRAAAAAVTHDRLGDPGEGGELLLRVPKNSKNVSRGVSEYYECLRMARGAKLAHDRLGDPGEGGELLLRVPKNSKNVSRGV
jgi:hypothetical protein